MLLKLLSTYVAIGLMCLASANAYADDDFVIAAKLLSARSFDNKLPDQSVEGWLRKHIPLEYQIVWGEIIADCGEATGSAIDAERDMPLCAEVEVKRGTKLVGYISLMVGTRKRGLLKEGNGLYFGYLEHAGTKYNFKHLNDVLNVK